MDLVTETIKNYLDSMGWKYELETEDDGDTNIIYTGIEGDNESIRIRVIVYVRSCMCQVACQSETIVSKECIPGAIFAMNEFNLRARIVSGCVTDKGAITFWLGRNTDGDTFSEEAFGADFDMLLKVTDRETAQIFKKAVQYTANGNPKAGLLPNPN